MVGTSVLRLSRARKVVLAFTLVAAATWGLPTTPSGAAPTTFSAAGANPAAIQAKVDEFRAALGGANNGTGNSVFRTGRREVNWDDVPDASASPNFLDPKFYNTTAPKGLVANSVELTGSSFNDLHVSADASNPTTTAVEFGNIDSSYQATFQPFSAPRIMTVRGGHVLEVRFFVPGTNIPATVSGFGAVFADVDTGTGPRAAVLRGYDADGDQIVALAATAANNGLSFAGFTFTAGERLAKVLIVAGNADLATGVGDSVATDIVAMDDFIFGEPRAMEDHPADFDGDGGTDLSVFRPSEGRWFTKDSGTGTVQATSFGLTGDIPVAADYDGDGRTDLGVYRPSNGGWFIQRSTAGPSTTFFGLPDDIPAPADYDKDGKTDIAVYRPSVGGWYITQSSNGALRNEFFGLSGDIPVPRMP
jgi:hypothetical protein